MAGFDPPQLNSEGAKADNKETLATSPKSAVSRLFLRVFAPLLFISNIE